jgi:hypothetical protein
MYGHVKLEMGYNLWTILLVEDIFFVCINQGNVCSFPFFVYFILKVIMNFTIELLLWTLI